MIINSFKNQWCFVKVNEYIIFIVNLFLVEFLTQKNFIGNLINSTFTQKI